MNNETKIPYAQLEDYYNRCQVEIQRLETENAAFRQSAGVFTERELKYILEDVVHYAEFIHPEAMSISNKIKSILSEPQPPVDIDGVGGKDKRFG